jgi:hypothetical protein
VSAQKQTYYPYLTSGEQRGEAQFARKKKGLFASA